VSSSTLKNLLVPPDKSKYPFFSYLGYPLFYPSAFHTSGSSDAKSNAVLLLKIPMPVISRNEKRLDLI
jgi:hypothetical protein